jgi:hypothetical protein
MSRPIPTKTKDEWMGCSTRMLSAEGAWKSLERMGDELKSSKKPTLEEKKELMDRIRSNASEWIKTTTAARDAAYATILRLLDPEGNDSGKAVGMLDETLKGRDVPVFRQAVGEAVFYYLTKFLDKMSEQNAQPVSKVICRVVPLMPDKNKALAALNKMERLQLPYQVDEAVSSMLGSLNAGRA